ncbi:MAG: tetratricopeptide repeat protein [Chthoniobacterales bacterium]
MKVGEGAVILFLVLGSLGAKVVAPTKAEIEAMYAAAAQELNSGNYSETLKQLDAIDARQPDVAAAKNLRGVALMRMGEYGLAEKALQKAREVDPNLWEARFNLAEVPFLEKNWAEARDRFAALAEEPSEEVQGATADVIQFKILLTYLLQDKEKNATPILDRLKASSASPGFYYAKAALAFRQKDETDARVNLRAAEKAYSPQLNKLFVESFYEVGWLPKPDGAVPVALEVISQADRVAHAQAAFEKAARAFRQRDFEGALKLLDEVDAAAPNQAVSYNLHGEIFLEEGKEKEAEAAFRNALVADPQFQDARYNLARIPFKERDYEKSRQEFEALLGAISGDKQERHREELVRYQIYLTLLLEGRDSAAQKALEEFKMMDDTPALYYAQAAWAFQHGNSKQAGNWVANAGNLFSPEMNRSFAAPLSDLGWLAKPAETQPRPSAVALTKPGPPPSPGPSASAARTEGTPGNPVALSESGAPPSPLEKTPSPGPEPSASAAIELAATASPAPTQTPAPAIAQNEARNEQPAGSPPTEPTASAKNVGREEEESTSGPEEAHGRTERKRALHSRGTSTGKKRAPRAKRVASSTASPKPEMVSEPPQNLGDKVVRFLLYPFRHRKEKTANPEADSTVARSSARATPSPSAESRRKN